MVFRRWGQRSKHRQWTCEFWKAENRKPDIRPIFGDFWEKKPEKQTWSVPVCDLEAENRKAVIVAKHAVFEFFESPGQKTRHELFELRFWKAENRKADIRLKHSVFKSWGQKTRHEWNHSFSESRGKKSRHGPCLDGFKKREKAGHVEHAFSFVQSLQGGAKATTCMLCWQIGFLREVIYMNICTAVCDAIQIDGRAEIGVHVHKCRQFVLATRTESRFHSR